MKKIALFMILTLVTAAPVVAATYTVNSSGGGDYTSIQSCADNATGGDICLVSGGTYAGVTMTKSGNSNTSHIIIRADSSGSMPTITGNFNLSNRSYITIDGFNLQRSVVGSGCSFIKIMNNRFTNNDIGVGGGSNSLDGTDILIDGNTFGDRGDDVVKGNGDRWVIRNNVATGINDTQDEHIDFYQNSCKNLPADFVLIENNTYTDITGGNTHFFLINCSSGKRTNHILRYNKIRDLGSNAITFDDSAGGTGFDGATAYNNTFVRVKRGSGTSTYAISMADVNTGRGAQNNIYYDSLNPNDARGATPAGNNCDGGLVYDPDDSTINLNDCLENASGVVVGKDPKFRNAAGNDFSLQDDSPAINAGSHLTVVASSDSGSGNTLMVNNPYYFQAGWAGVSPDWIAVGSVSNTVRISSINYSTGAITLASSISRSDGDPVYLFRNSSGIQVLSGSAPDIGAVESGVVGSPPPPYDPPPADDSPTLPAPTGLILYPTGINVVAVRASSDDGNLPQNTLDTNIATRWSANGRGEWIEFDLGSVQTVSRADISFYLGNERTSSFSIEVSTDRNTWTEVYTGISSGNEVIQERHIFTSIQSARYVRIVGNGNASNDWNSITEVDIF